MKDLSGFYSHMSLAAHIPLDPRKTPRQGRSVATVEAIYDATIQVLLKSGFDRLTTVRIATRAGVSVGTLYQYFPNKQALLFAVLERHLLRVVEAIEAICTSNRFQPLEVMVHSLVDGFVDAKLADRDSAVALYRIAGEAGGDLIVDRTRKRYEAAMKGMLQTANLPPAELSFIVHMIYLVMAGTLRGHLESDAPPERTRKLREHLQTLILSYCQAFRAR